jgi:SAM-dependent methyltransferase
VTINDIDFAELYREHMRRSGRPSKPASAWDSRAETMSSKPLRGVYSDAFIERMDLAGAETLLDIGCGPGTICLLLADRLRHVYGLDYSQVMLDCLMQNAAEHGLDNVQPLLRAWEDDWSDIPVCDIVVASRSSAVADMAAAIDKLNAHARQRVYMTSLVGGHFVDPAIAALLGREHQGFPDYIYIINILHRLGIHPRLDYIEIPSRLAGAENFSAFAEKVSWTFGELNSDERTALRSWYDADPARAKRGGAPMRWAFIGWDVDR